MGKNKNKKSTGNRGFRIDLFAADRLESVAAPKITPTSIALREFVLSSHIFQTKQSAIRFILEESYPVIASASPEVIENAVAGMGCERGPKPPDRCWILNKIQSSPRWTSPMDRVIEFIQDWEIAIHPAFNG